MIVKIIYQCPGCNSKNIIEGNRFSDFSCEDCGINFNKEDSVRCDDE